MRADWVIFEKRLEQIVLRPTEKKLSDFQKQKIHPPSLNFGRFVMINPDLIFQLNGFREGTFFIVGEGVGGLGRGLGEEGHQSNF